MKRSDRVRAALAGPLFWVVLGGLLMVSAVSVIVYRQEFSVLGQQVGDGEDHELFRWRAFAQHYQPLFGMLVWDAPVGIQIDDRDASSGLVVTRDASGVHVRRTAFLRREDPGVVLRMDRGTAHDLLGSVPATAPDAIWQMMKDRLGARRIIVLSDPDLARLERDGYLAFMRALDTRPQELEWPQVRERLGENLDE